MGANLQMDPPEVEALRGKGSFCGQGHPQDEPPGDGALLGMGSSWMRNPPGLVVLLGIGPSGTVLILGP